MGDFSDKFIHKHEGNLHQKLLLIGIFYKLAWTLPPLPHSPYLETNPDFDKKILSVLYYLYGISDFDKNFR